MKTSLKIFAYALAISFAFLACEDTGTNNNELELPPSSNLGSSSSVENSSSSGELVAVAEIPVRHSSVKSYQRIWRENVLEYGSGFTADEDILKLWFPHVFDDEQTNECNYFALYFTTSSAPFRSYRILSQDMTLYLVSCTPEEGKSYVVSTDLIYETMLICDDKAGTLRKSIDLDLFNHYLIPDWNCDSEVGGPAQEDVFF